MDREVLSRCALFRSITAEQTSLLLGCLSCELRRLDAGLRTYLPDGTLAVVCSGELERSDGVARPSEVVFGFAAVTALSPCEILVFDTARLCRLCKNACSFHRAAIANLPGLCVNARAFF